MAWIGVYQSLPSHRKTKKLARALGLKVPSGIPQTVGHLTMLWLWCVDNAPDGDLSSIDKEDIADAAGWSKAANAFYDALLSAGFIDEGGVIHDWDDHNGKLVTSREAKKEGNRERQQRYRDKQKQPGVTQDGDNALVTRYGGVSNSVTRNARNGARLQYSTLQYSTLQNTAATAAERNGGGNDADALRISDSEHAAHIVAMNAIEDAWQDVKGEIKTYDTNKINLLMADYPADWILEAIQIAGGGKEQTWRYVEGILRKFKKNGRTDSAARDTPDAPSDVEEDDTF